jgi:hypothetical protein
VLTNGRRHRDLATLLQSLTISLRLRASSIVASIFVSSDTGLEIRPPSVMPGGEGVFDDALDLGADADEGGEEVEDDGDGAGEDGFDFGSFEGVGNLRFSGLGRPLRQSPNLGCLDAAVVVVVQRVDHRIVGMLVIQSDQPSCSPRLTDLNVRGMVG